MGDFNGDGCSDLAAFTRGVTADVMVSKSFRGLQELCFRSTSAAKWHDNFAPGSEVTAPGHGW